MKNGFEIRDGILRIFIRRQQGADLVMHLDISDRDLANAINGRICASWNPASRTFYAYFHQTTDGKQRTIWFHRHLMNCPVGLLVDHRNHDGLDNRRCNLRNVNGTVNNLNRQGPSSKNKTSRVRGVHLHKRSGRWRAQIGFEGKLLSLGLFDTKEAAKAAFDTKLAELTAQDKLLEVGMPTA